MEDTMKRLYLMVCVFLTLSFPFLAANLVNIAGKEIVVELYMKALLATLIFFVVTGFHLLTKRTGTLDQLKEVYGNKNLPFYVVLFGCVMIFIAFVARIFGFLTFIAAIAYAFDFAPAAMFLFALGVYLTGVATAAYDLTLEMGVRASNRSEANKSDKGEKNEF